MKLRTSLKLSLLVVSLGITLANAEETPVAEEAPVAEETPVAKNKPIAKKKHMSTPPAPDGMNDDGTAREKRLEELTELREKLEAATDPEEKERLVAEIQQAIHDLGKDTL